MIDLTPFLGTNYSIMLEDTLGNGMLQYDLEYIFAGITLILTLNFIYSCLIHVVKRCLRGQKND